MKLIVGLGNPGEKYSKNRHNVGFMVVDKIAQTKEMTFEMSKKFNAEICQTKQFLLVKPQTFMNDSGQAIAKIANFYKLKYEDVYVIHDDLDIQLGIYKILFGRGPRVHNGLISVKQETGTDQFYNVRIGVDNREVKGNRGIPGVVYSLQDFRAEEREIIDEVIGKIVEELKVVVS